MNWVKGRNNKVNMGDKVEMCMDNVKFYVENINDLFLAPSINSEVLPEDYATVAGMYHALLTNTPPKGKVVGYGANDSGPKPWNSDKWVDLKDKKVLRVKLKLKYGEYETFISERYVKKI